MDHGVERNSITFTYRIQSNQRTYLSTHKQLSVRCIS